MKEVAGKCFSCGTYCTVAPSSRKFYTCQKCGHIGRSYYFEGQIAHDKVVADWERMTLDQKTDRLKEIGILDADGNLSAIYGGEHMKSHHSEKIDLVQRLAEFDVEDIEEFAQAAKDLRQTPMGKVPKEKLEELSLRLSHLQDETWVEIPCKAEGIMYIQAHFYASEGKFEHCSGPDFRITKLKMGEPSRTPKPDPSSDLLSPDADHIYLRKELEPSLDAFADLRKWEEDIQEVAETYGVDLHDLTKRIRKIKECRDIDANNA